MIYDKTKGFNLDHWNQLSSEVQSLQNGIWEIIIRKPQRTQKQNRTIHAVFHDLATELNGIGVELSFGNFKACFTPNTAKEFFIEIYLAGKRTSDCDTQELAGALDKMIHDVNSKGGTLAIKNDDYISLMESLK
jgi:hypothetical protein